MVHWEITGLSKKFNGWWTSQKFTCAGNEYDIIFSVNENEKSWRIELQPTGKRTLVSNKISFHNSFVADRSIHDGLTSVTVFQIGEMKHMERDRPGGWRPVIFRSKCPICAFDSTATYYSSHPIFQLILKFENKGLADLQADELQVKFIVRGQEMAAHLRVIASASPVMAAMFAQNQFEEGYSRVAKIEDFAPEVFQGMLRYLHTGQVPDLSRLVDQWFLIADMYDISQLKSECTRYWMSRLTLNNVIHLMMLAFQHHDSNLLQAALHFTAKNEDKVRNIPGWRSLAERAPEIFQLVQRMFSVEKVAGKQSRKRRWQEI